MDRRKQMEGTGDVHERYDREGEGEGTGESRLRQRHSSGVETSAAPEDTLPNTASDEWPDLDDLDDPVRLPPLPDEPSVPDDEDGDADARSSGASLPWRANNTVPDSIPAAEPGLLSGWAERGIRRPDEEEEYSPAFDDESSPREALDSNQLDEWADSQGDTLLTKMDMDWDEEEALTTLRDGSSSTILPPPGSESDTLPPEDGDAVERHGAKVQNIVPFRPPTGLNLPILAAGTTQPGEMFSPFARRPPAGGKTRGLWYAGAAAVGVVLAFVVRAALGPPATATVILVTKPVDASVRVDGQPVGTSSSPFTIQGLAPDVDHTIEIRKEGYLVRTEKVRLAAAEVKTLPELALAAAPTGFALTSTPAGAAAWIDGRKLDHVTPLRIEDLAAGAHKIRLELAGHQPWEGEFQVAVGQIMDVPPVQLTARKLTWAERVAARRAAAAATRAERAAAAAARSPVKPSTGGTRDDQAEDDDDPAPENEAERGSNSVPSHTAEPKVRKRFFSGEEAEQRLQRRSEPSSADSDEPADAKDEAPPEPEPSRKPIAVGGEVPAGANEAEKGALSINSRPWSQVTIDGKLIGNTPQIAVPLVAGRHKVKLANPELGIVRGFTVDIVAGETTTKTVEFGQ